MREQRQTKQDEQTFKNNYRRKSVNPSKKKYVTSNLIQTSEPGMRGTSSGINLLNSSTAFKTMGSTQTLNMSASKNRRLIGSSAVVSRRTIRPVAQSALSFVQNESPTASRPGLFSNQKARAESHLNYYESSVKKVGLPRVVTKQSMFSTPDKGRQALRYNESALGMSANKQAYKSYTEIKSPFLRTGGRSRASNPAFQYNERSEAGDEQQVVQSQFNSSSRLAILINEQNQRQGATKIVQATNLDKL